MQQLTDGRLVLSATDLTNHLACPHLTQQRLQMARGERGRPRTTESAHADLLRKRGDAHEQAELQKLIAAAGGEEHWAELPSVRRYDDEGRYQPPTAELLEECAAETRRAMEAGTRLLFQASFFDGRWQGQTDFLRRIDLADATDARTRKAIERSTFGDYAYEVLDTKLSKAVKPHVVHQLLVYSRLVGRVQNTELPVARIILGDGTHEPVELGAYGAMHRRVVRRFEQVVDAPGIATYPEPLEHCAICSLAGECEQVRRDDDHLSFVARAARGHREHLVGAGIQTLAGLAGTDGETQVDGLDPARFSRLRAQATLQLESRETKQPTRDHLEPERAAGYAALPPHSAGDVFFDLEGDPHVGAEGIEYLWGWSEPGGGAYHHVWAHDEDEERAALEAFVAHVEQQRAAHPGLHVYHYAPHEKSKLLSLSVKYGVCEQELDDWARAGVLVDLYAVVARGLLVGEESYSLKKLERHHGFRRLQTSVREGGGSIVAYEEWLETQDDAALEAIRAYNEEDCRSTESLRDWMSGVLIPEAEQQYGVSFDDYRKAEPEQPFEEPEWVGAMRELQQRLETSAGALGDSSEQAARRLLGHLLLYHGREQKPEWWDYFRLKDATDPLDLIDERSALGGLSPDPSIEPVPVNKSLLHTLWCPPQEFKEPMGVIDPETGKSETIVDVDAAAGRVVLKRGPKRAEDPLPTSLVPGSPVDPTVLRKALAELATSVLDGDGRFGAVRALLRRDLPDVGADEAGAAGASDVAAAGAAGVGDETSDLVDAALAMRSSYLPVQGPPGTGKTYNAARVIVAALVAGLRVGITAQSHAAIQNLLRAVEQHAAELGETNARATAWTGLYKGDPEVYVSDAGLVETIDGAAGNKAVDAAGPAGDAPGAPRLIAGTAWTMSRPALREQLDLLFVDEAGQLALATTIAAGTATRSLVLLGDPQQLPQVTKAAHPGGAGASVLEHVLGDAATVPPERGVLLRQSWRMHPEICGFISDHAYDGKLTPHRDCDGQRIDAPGALTGAGIRVLEVEHQGSSQSSPAEASAIAAACRELLAGGTVVDRGAERPRVLEPRDIMVVAPYNLAVQAIAAAVPEGVRVGTVDRFQGQEAPVVFYALTCSSAEDVPRGLDFLFDANRLNVAISRAQTLAVLVHAPQLLDAHCRTSKAMQLVDGACRLAERATPLGASGSLAPTGDDRADIAI